VFLGWAQDINLQFQYSNPSHVESILQDVLYLSMEFERTRNDLSKSLAELYPKWSVDEWIMTNVDPYTEKLRNLKTNLAKILDNTVFPIRPLQLETHNLLDDDKSYVSNIP
jgi:hypothetical protein